MALTRTSKMRPWSLAIFTKTLKLVTTIMCCRSVIPNLKQIDNKYEKYR